MFKCPFRSEYMKPTRYNTSKCVEMLPELTHKFSKDKERHWIIASVSSRGFYSRFGRESRGISIGSKRKY